MARSEAEWRLEMYEDAVERQAALLREVDAMAAAGQAGKAGYDGMLADLNALNVALGDPIVEDDPLVAQWERDLQAGKTPDLSERHR